MIAAESRAPSPGWIPAGARGWKIALWYGVLGSLWILSSGWVLRELVHDDALRGLIEDAKGWFFVAVTALLLGLVLERRFREIQRSTQLLQESEERLRLMGDNLPDTYVFQYLHPVDSPARFTYVSAGVQQVHGIPAEAVLHDASCLHAQLDLAQWGAVASAESESAQHLADFDMELAMRRSDGESRLLHVRSRPRRNRAGQVQWDGIATDITKRKQAETALKQAEEKLTELNHTLENRVLERTAELRAANQELDAFAYAVSHDLRAPLRALSGFSHALIEDHGAALHGKSREYLDEIILASRQMGELIDGLLRLSRCTRSELRRDQVDISDLASRILGDLAQAEPARRVSWTVEPGLNARGDARMLEVVLANLLDNAWKYTAKTQQPTIRVHGERDAGKQVFCVTDNGAGFDMQYAARLFQPFQRLHREDEFPGIGIGLATVQRIVQRHGGDLHANAAPGQGATFRFSLPHLEDPHNERV